MPAAGGARASSHHGAQAARHVEPATAAERVDAACRLAVAGKLAARDLAVWAHDLRLTEAEFRLLWLLYRGGGGEWAGQLASPHEAVPATVHFDQVDLADQLAVSTAQVSGVVERLQLRQLVVGVRDSSDRRRQLWRLTEQGCALVQAVLRSVAKAFQRYETIPPLAPPFERGRLPEAA